ncbi:lysine decarboxylase, partial [Staphylococcus equorum]
YFQSSSPSYLLMMSLELAHQFYKDYNSKLFFKKRDQLIQALKEIGAEVVKVEDPLKLNIRCNGYTGFELQKYFETKDIYVELADEHQVLFVLPLWHKGDTYPFDLLIERIRQIELEERDTQTPDQSAFRTEEGTYQAGDIVDTKSIDISHAGSKV